MIGDSNAHHNATLFTPNHPRQTPHITPHNHLMRHPHWHHINTPIQVMGNDRRGNGEQAIYDRNADHHVQVPVAFGQDQHLRVAVLHQKEIALGAKLITPVVEIL